MTKLKFVVIFVVEFAIELFAAFITHQLSRVQSEADMNPSLFFTMHDIQQV